MGRNEAKDASDRLGNGLDNGPEIKIGDGMSDVVSREMLDGNGNRNPDDIGIRMAGETVDRMDIATFDSIGSGHAEKYADLMLDWTFKRVFGETGDKGLLISLLESVLGFGIEDISYLPNELKGGAEQNKGTRMDLRCRCTDGRRIIVEVQTYWQEHFFRRCMVYAAGEYISQSRRGRSYGIPEPVYLVALLAESATLAHSFHEPQYRGRCIYRYVMSESETGELLFDTINVTFVELGDFRKVEGECGTMLDKWLFVLKNMRRLDSLPSNFRERLFVRLFESVEVSRMTPEEMNAYDRARLAEFDRINILRSAENSGLEKGAAQEKLEIARKMKADGIQTEVISKYTGLSIRDIEML